MRRLSTTAGGRREHPPAAPKLATIPGSPSTGRRRRGSLGNAAIAAVLSGNEEAVAAAPLVSPEALYAKGAELISKQGALVTACLLTIDPASRPLSAFASAQLSAAVALLPEGDVLDDDSGVGSDGA